MTNEKCGIPSSWFTKGTKLRILDDLHHVIVLVDEYILVTKRWLRHKARWHYETHNIYGLEVYYDNNLLKKVR